MSIKQDLILVIDDNPTNIDVLFDLLKDYGFKVLVAKDGETGLKRAKMVSPALILLDVLMPKIDGFETCRRLKACEETQDIPVIFMTALAESVDKVRGLSLGAVDYITKPLQHQEVLARINVHLKIKHLTEELQARNFRLQQEICSRKLLETALNVSEEKFYKIFRSSPEPIFICTLNNEKFIEVNDSFCQLTGYYREQVIGKTAHQLNYWVNKDQQISILKKLESSEIVRNIEVDYRMASGEIKNLLFSAEVIIYNEEKCLLCLPKDITERKQAELAIKKANVELQKTNRELEQLNKELESFNYAVSHDIRNPLNNINGFTYLLLESYPKILDEDLKQYLTIIYESGVRIENIIDNLIKLSQIKHTPLVIQKVNLSELVEQIFQQLKKCNKERAIHLKFMPNLKVNGDQGLLKIALENLLNNAWKYTTKQANSLIEFGLIKAEDIQEFQTSINSQENVYFIKDNGVGFNMENVAQIFTPFKRLHSQDEYEGTGIGLSTVQRIIHQHQGTIWCTSKINKGTTFYFTIGYLL